MEPVIFRIGELNENGQQQWPYQLIIYVSFVAIVFGLLFAADSCNPRWI
jgi:hypothetical protein